MLTGVASAAGSSFSDVRDEATAVNADILRGEMGFDGVIVTDALNMKAISAALKPSRASIA